MVQWVRIAVFLLAGTYLWLYPNFLLVPDDYRESFWSLNYNISHKGLVVDREIIEIQSIFNSHQVERVGVLVNGQLHYYWVANATVGRKLVEQELAKFETRGSVIVLAEPISYMPYSISRL